MLIPIKRWIACFLIGVLFLLCACSAENGDSSSSSVEEISNSSQGTVSQENSGVAVNPLQEKNLSYALAALPKSLDPAKIITASDATFLYNTLEGLVRLYNNEVQPGLAHSWETQDGLTYTFHLRDAIWEDGEPVTAYDFEYAFRRLLDPYVEVLSDSLLIIKNANSYRAGTLADDSTLGVKAVDAKTFEITLEKKTPHFIDLLAAELHVYPLRENIAEPAGEEFATSAGTYLSCGPFRLKSWDESSIILEKNPTYWDAKNIHLDKISCFAVSDGATRSVMFEGGELNLYVEYLKSNESQYSSFRTGLENTLVSLQVNMEGMSEETKAILSNADFRKALSYAVDRQELVSQKAIKGSTAANRFVGGNIRAQAGLFRNAYAVENVPLSGDAAEAKKYLAQALAALETTVDVLPNLTFVCYDTITTKPVAQWLIETWKETLGLKNITLQLLPAAEAVPKYVSGEYDLGLQISTSEYLDPYAQLSLWSAESSRNWTRWQSSEYTDLLNASDELSGEKRLQKLAECEQYLINNGPQIPLYFRGFLYNMDSTVKDIGISDVGVNVQMIYADIE